MESKITRRGVVPSIHRWVYANGWYATAAFGVVSCLAFPFSPLPSACLFFAAVGLAGIRVFVDFLEQLIAVIEEDSDRDERLAPYRVHGAQQASDVDDDPEDEHLGHQTNVVRTYDDWERLELEE